MNDTNKTDKRKLSSSKNLAKARQTKLDRLARNKEEKTTEYHFEDDLSTDSDSEEDVIIVKPKSKRNRKKEETTNKNVDPLKQELAELRQLLESLTVKKKKPKRSKQVIQIVNPQPAQKKPSADLETLKKRMLLNFN